MCTSCVLRARLKNHPNEPMGRLLVPCLGSKTTFVNLHVCGLAREVSKSMTTALEQSLDIRDGMRAVPDSPDRLALAYDGGEGLMDGGRAYKPCLHFSSLASLRRSPSVGTKTRVSSSHVLPSWGTKSQRKRLHGGPGTRYPTSTLKPLPVALHGGIWSYAVLNASIATARGGMFTVSWRSSRRYARIDTKTKKSAMHGDDSCSLLQCPTPRRKRSRLYKAPRSPRCFGLHYIPSPSRKTKTLGRL